MENRNVSHDEGQIYLAEWGNPNILRSHITFFEKKIPEEIDKFKTILNPSITPCPNFAAWIRLKAELVCNLMYYNYHRCTGEDWDKIIKNGFDSIKNKIRELIIKDNKTNSNLKFVFSEILESIELTIQLRHCFQHGGIPNILRENGKEYLASIRGILNPVNFEETKLIFEKAEYFSETLPKPTIIVGA